MVLAIKIPLQDAQKAKQYLLSKEYLNHNYKPKKEDGMLFFPVTEEYEGTYPLVNTTLHKHKKLLQAEPLKEVLEKHLSKKELQQVNTAYDVLGSIAIIEIPPELEDKQTVIGKLLLQSNPLVKTVLAKQNKHEGVYRTQELKHLAGNKTKVARYKENGCTITVNVESVYFSARLSTERKRIAQQIQEGEDVLVMFSGAGPYPCVFSKNSPAQHIVGVEINPQGHKYALKNIAENKCNNVDLYCGDVREVIPTLDETFDRIVMPLPKTAEEFLDITLPLARKGATIHMYAFYHQDDFNKATQEIDRYCKKAGRKYEIIDIIKAGQHAPRTYRICVDFKLLD
ncbi:MAG: class I SAM-dependent methyltransferase [Nanobdellota archaeon]